MRLVKNNRHAFIFAIAFFLFLVLMVFFVGYKFVFTPKKAVENSDSKNVFTSLFIKKVNEYNKNNENYLVSPYSVEITLNMLKEGANNDSREELAKVINDNFSYLTNENVLVANGIFINDDYKDYVDSKFSNILKSKYKSEILYDTFKTPDVINNWANEKTNGMIPKLLDEGDEDMVLGLGNAIMIDAIWKNEFECNSTSSEKFKLNDESTIDVEMMHNKYESDVKFLDGKDKGIKLQYKENLDFIAIVPDSGVDDYIDRLSASALDDIVGNFISASENDIVNLSIPRFSYEYNLDNFSNVLQDIGIKTIFDEEKADLSGIISKEKIDFLSINNLYVKNAVHKTNINFKEKGTKASAVTILSVESNSVYDIGNTKIHEIKFDKPFIYIIRDSSSHDILFFGVVNKPNEWNGSTCTG